MLRRSIFPVWRRCFCGLILVVFAECLLRGAVLPAGLWDFDDPQDLLRATTGASLQLHGTHNAVDGPWAGNAAVRIGIGSHYTCLHGIPANGSGTLVNRYSLLIDFRIAMLGSWYCFFQTDPSNASDGDCFIHPSSGSIGVSQTGYSASSCQVGVWQRVVVTVDNEHGVYQIYLDGAQILNGSSQAVDGRFALQQKLLLLADDDGEDAVLDVSRVAVYDVCLSAAQVAELGSIQAEDPSNHPPAISLGSAGPTNTTTGSMEEFQFTATDPDQDQVQVRIDWGDGSDLSPWSGMVGSGQHVAFTHAYQEPGGFEIRALARDVRGQAGVWTSVQTVSVSGVAQIRYLTPPYLQNVRTNAIAILWELSTGREAAVEYGLSTNYGFLMTSSHRPSGADTEIYRCALTNLTPGTQYHYRVTVDGQPSVNGVFVTAPVRTPSFSFSVWSDSQGSNHGAYDADPLEPTKSMFRHMATNHIQFAVTCGDLAESGASYSDTRQYYLDRAAALLGSTTPWFVAWGNHDGGPSTVIRRFADLPSQQRPGYDAGYGSYSFDYAGCHFICIDNASSAVDIASWLESDLQSPANRNAKFTFLFIHVPPYCELWLDGDSGLRATLVPLMETYGVDVCFSGHTHEYSRGFLNGVYYCVTGGGSWLDLPEVLVADWDHMTVGGHHAIPGVLKPSEQGGGGLVNEYVRVDVSEDSFTASMIGFAPDGTELGVLDRFSLSRTTSPHPPANPIITGPSSIDVFEDTSLPLVCSSFSDADPGDQQLQSRWRVCRSAAVEQSDTILIEQTTGPGVTNCAIAIDRLQPGQIVYASVQHTATDGQVSEFATPIAIRILPDPLYLEDFEKVTEFSLPEGWSADHQTTTNNPTWDPDDPQSNSYLTWTVVSADRLAALGANRLSVPGVVQGKCVYAESDQRAGSQIQRLTTPDFDLHAATNVALVFQSNYMQNQDSLAALEFSTNRGTSWSPVFYLLDTPDVIPTGDGLAVDGGATFTRVDPDGVPTADGGASTGGTYGEHILCRPFEALGAYVQGRINDSTVESKRLEHHRILWADHQSAVRFRFTLVGTASWFWGIDNFGLYGTVIQPEPFRILGVSRSGDDLLIRWTGPVGSCQVQCCADLQTGAWTDCGPAVDASQGAVSLPASAAKGFYRLRLVPYGHADASTAWV